VVPMVAKVARPGTALYVARSKLTICRKPKHGQRSSE
jgi:hypothetical protein